MQREIVFAGKGFLTGFVVACLKPKHLSCLLPLRLHRVSICPAAVNLSFSYLPSKACKQLVHLKRNYISYQARRGRMYMHLKTSWQHLKAWNSNLSMQQTGLSLLEIRYLMALKIVFFYARLAASHCIDLLYLNCYLL